MNTPQFVNTTTPFQPAPDDCWGEGRYGYENLCPLLFNFGGLLQRVVSQAGSYYFNQEFHDNECGIYKCEGGCRIQGKGDLVLGKRMCYFDHQRGKLSAKEKTNLKKMAELITTIVLEWDPMNPVQSMYNSASKVVGCDPEALKKVIEEGRSGGVFGGNALSDFFDWNPFSQPPINEAYEKWCWVNVFGKPESEIVQKQADRHLGQDLLKKINEKIKACNPGTWQSAMCCSPRRSDKGLGFWINTGRSTNIDGWKSQADIEAYLASDGKIVDTARY